MKAVLNFLIRMVFLGAISAPSFGDCIMAYRNEIRHGVLNRKTEYRQALALLRPNDSTQKKALAQFRELLQQNDETAKLELLDNEILSVLDEPPQKIGHFI